MNKDERTTTLTKILDNKIVAIIRGAQPSAVIRMAHALLKGGVQALEVTLNSPKALSVIEQLSDEFGEQMLIGAGTVLDAASARAAVSAGARFIISPIVDIKTIRATRRYGAVSIPGAYTPTEVVTAFVHGGEIIKVFPASAGSHYIRELRGPLPHIPLMPTGGITVENIQAYQQAGGVAFGIGSALINTNEAVTDNYLEELTNKARRFVQAVSKQTA